MQRTVIKNSELEEWRSILEMGVFIECVFKRVKHVFTQRKKFQTSYGNYKQFIEEYMPVYKYLKHIYKSDEDVLYRHVGVGNQPYDGEIKKKKIVSRIEIGYPILGKEAYLRSLELIDKGSVVHLYDKEYFQKIREVILETAKKKAIKVYDETWLLIYYPFVEQLYPGDTGLPEEEFSNLIEELRSITYKTRKVDFFVPSFQYNNYLGSQIKPERLYRIKE